MCDRALHHHPHGHQAAPPQPTPRERTARPLLEHNLGGLQALRVRVAAGRA
ncbi:hypothetical protein [Streptomyces sp. NBC_00996]|uniref:hypothetical protein n=1 Tax=Streptomyces sp. NBC_00996 TaxID=2903710 RepID=UPI003865D78F|nr:hypothetical protein OG390_48905 [Streptomyces sp. NBC_00996]